MKIASDTSTLYSPREAMALGVHVFPLCVTLKDKTYREFEDIQSKEFIKLIKEGIFPSSSQPAIGEMFEMFEKDSEEILYISVADGLSGTYQSALGVKESIKNNKHIHIFNSKTLCGPHRHLIQVALRLKEEGYNLKEIISELESNIQTIQSFLIPQDFEYLKRGGRLTPIAATIGGMLKIVPILVQSEDGMRLEKAGIKRTMKGAVSEVINKFIEKGIDENYKIFVSHATSEKQVQEVVSQIKEQLHHVCVEVYDLSPAFITQGGPGCIAIQMIKI